MAQYIGIIKGNRGETSRLGTKKSGLHASLRGWKIGVSVVLSFDEKEQRDVISIVRTGGSLNGHIREPLIEIREA